MKLLRILLGGWALTWSVWCLGANTYIYDSAGRLSSVAYADGTLISYGYDAAGNVVSRTLGKVVTGPVTLDVDGSGASTKYDVATDGLLILRYLFGVTGTALTTNALGATATRTDPAALKTFLDGIRTALDIDGNGQVDALTDGVLIRRYLSGLRGSALIAGGVVDPLGTRSTAAAIETYLQSLMP